MMGEDDLRWTAKGEEDPAQTTMDDHHRTVRGVCHNKETLKARHKDIQTLGEVLLRLEGDMDHPDKINTMATAIGGDIQVRE